MNNWLCALAIFISQGAWSSQFTDALITAAETNSLAPLETYNTYSFDMAVHSQRVDAIQAAARIMARVEACAVPLELDGYRGELSKAINLLVQVRDAKRPKPSPGTKEYSEIRTQIKIVEVALEYANGLVADVNSGNHCKMGFKNWEPELEASGF